MYKQAYIKPSFDKLGFLFCVVLLAGRKRWAIYLKESWYAKHTVIDGRQVTFDGTGGQLFGNYIKWFLLTIITLGIYSFWLSLKMKAWVTKHTHLV